MNANTAWNQISAETKMRTGARDPMNDEGKGLIFRVGPSTRLIKIVVRLDPTDTYSVRCVAISERLNVCEVGTVSDVHCEDLSRAVEELSGSIAVISSTLELHEIPLFYLHTLRDHYFRKGWKLREEGRDFVVLGFADLRTILLCPSPSKFDCPCCGKPHVDWGEWKTRPHHTHRCEHCCHEWRVDALVYGVER